MHIEEGYDYAQAYVHDRRCGEDPCRKVGASEADLPAAFRESDRRNCR